MPSWKSSSSDFRPVHKTIKPLTTLLLAVLVLANAAAAQRVTLDQVEAALRNGDAERARSVLLQWNQQEHRRIDANTTARALILGARLETRAQRAEDAYLGVALSYATSPFAAEALLRLGQARLVAGDAKQATVYLQRLISDYPRSELRSTALDFLHRARTAAPTAIVPKNGAYALQVAAFRDASNAKGFARALQRAGFDARTVTVPENGLLRVRVGHFPTAAQASAALAALKAAGYSGVIVADAARESILRD